MPLFDEGKKFRYELLRGAVPAPTHWRCILINDYVPGAEDDIATVVSNELVTQFGYQRQEVTLASTGSIVGVNYRSANATLNPFEADGASLSHDAAVIIADADNDPNGSYVVSAVDTTNDRLTINAHPFVDGDKVAVTAISAIMGGISANTVYYVKNLSANIVELYTDPALATKANITSSGTGTQYLRRAGGILYSYILYAAQTIAASGEQPIRIYFEEGDVA